MKISRYALSILLLAAIAITGCDSEEEDTQQEVQWCEENGGEACGDCLLQTANCDPLNDADCPPDCTPVTGSWFSARVAEYCVSGAQYDAYLEAYLKRGCGTASEESGETVSEGEETASEEEESAEEGEDSDWWDE